GRRRPHQGARFRSAVLRRARRAVARAAAGIEPAVDASARHRDAARRAPPDGGPDGHRDCVQHPKPRVGRPPAAGDRQGHGLLRVLYTLYQEDGPDWVRIRTATKEAHFAYLERHKDILVLGGAMLAEDGTTRVGSVLILNVPSRAAAEAFSADEPFRKAGLFK